MSSPSLSAHSPGSTPTSAREDYLECILQLIQQKGYARAVDIAANLGIAQASVTNMTQRLDAEGLLRYEKYRGVTLTPTGEKLARGVIQRHDILARLLRHFEIDEATIHRDVEGMEHHISRQTLRVLTALTEELDRSPELVERLKTTVK
ncbi:MAG TPA: transcriptional regulator MntR [Chthoniobacterales bacterium]